MLWFMGSQRVGHDWMTELIWISHGCTCVPHPEHPPHLPPHPIPQGHPGAPALNTLSTCCSLCLGPCYHLSSPTYLLHLPLITSPGMPGMCSLAALIGQTLSVNGLMAPLWHWTPFDFNLIFMCIMIDSYLPKVSSRKGGEIKSVWVHHDIPA